MAGCLIGQPRLADTWFAAETQYLAAPGERRANRGTDFAKFVLSAYE